MPVSLFLKFRDIVTPDLQDEINFAAEPGKTLFF